MINLLTGRQMKEADRYSVCNFGMHELVLMERAAIAVTEQICAQTASQSIFILCGTGNNGGDGLAAARLLLQRNKSVSVFVLGSRDKATDSWKKQYALLQNMGQSVDFCSTDQMPDASMFVRADVYVDALFGVGLSRELTGGYAEAVRLWNQSAEQYGAYRLAVDIPSGVDADTGAVWGCAVRADETVTFGYGKNGLCQYPGASLCGKVLIADIGIPQDAVFHITGRPMYALEQMDVKAWLPVRKSDGNKGTFGKVLILAGSEGMAGAAYLSTLASIRCGCGLAVAATHPANRTIMQQLIPEAITACYPVSAETDEQIRKNELKRWLKDLLKGVKAMVIGPGLSQNPTGLRLTELAIALHGEIPLIIDADSLNLLAGMEPCILGENVILTPHPGELGRLLKQTTEQVRRDLRASAVLLQRRYGCIAVCKDARTVTAVSQEIQYLNLTGNSGMATGGAGDVLTGIIASLAAQGLQPARAAVLGVWLHGAAGDLAAERYGRAGMKAGDICSCVGTVLAETEKH